MRWRRDAAGTGRRRARRRGRGARARPRRAAARGPAARAPTATGALARPCSSAREVVDREAGELGDLLAPQARARGGARRPAGRRRRGSGGRARSAGSRRDRRGSIALDDRARSLREGRPASPRLRRTLVIGRRRDTLEGMTTTLITGANKGLGYETARRLLAAGHDVWVAARDEERGRAAAEELGARFVALDVTDDASVAAAAEHVARHDRPRRARQQRRHLRRLHGARRRRARRRGARAAPRTSSASVRVTQAFRPLLDRSANPVIVNVSSGMGSLAVTTDPERLESTLIGLAYPASKSALNMLTSAVREGPAAHARQRRRPRLHGDGLQRPPRRQDASSRAPRSSSAWRSSTRPGRRAPTSTTRGGSLVALRG